MIAYTQEATADYLGQVLNIPRPERLANPEILASVLSTFVAMSKNRPELPRHEMRQVGEQAIKRVSEIEEILRLTVGSQQTMLALWDKMANSIRDYDEAVKSVFRDLERSAYAEQKLRFNGSKE